MELQGDVGHVESDSLHLEIVLVSVQDRCMVCARRTIGSDKSFWTHLMVPLGDEAQVEARFGPLEKVLVLSKIGARFALNIP